MRIVNLTQEKSAEALVAKACAYFSEHASAYTYANGEPKAGEFLAIRWNRYTVLVIKLDESFEPTLYPAYPFIKQDFPILENRI